MPPFKNFIIMGDWLSGAVNGVGNIATSLINNALENKRANEEREWNEQMMDKQNDWSLQMWNKTNAYNDPSAQLQRLRDAGLNPLYYGLDGSSANGLESAQALGYQRAQGANFENPVSAVIDAKYRQAQIANLQSDTAKKNNENLTETQRRENMAAEFDNLKQEYKNKLANEKLTDAQREKIEKESAWVDRLAAANEARATAEAELSQTQKKRIEELLEGEKILQSKNIEDFDHRWRKISAEIAKMAKETNLLQEDIENYALNHATNGFMGTGISLNNLGRLFSPNARVNKRDKVKKRNEVGQDFGNNVQTFR